jgi:ABC-type phosphate/phosphonate transport system permease subunit
MAKRGGRREREVPEAMLEYVAENMKERIYATITLLAVIVALWQTSSEHSIGGSVASILGTVTALWLATLISSRISHRAVHGKSLTTRDLAKITFTSSGLFVPAILPTIFVLVSSTKVMTLKTAFMAGIVALLLSLFVLSFTAGRRIYTSPVRLFVVSLGEMAIGIGVILLKLAIGE